MTKRKTAEEKAARMPRKRVAFSAPKDAATKAIFARNASTSPLLILPLEIRNKIYSELLGNRLIHLRYLYDDDVSFETSELLYAGMHQKNGKACGSAWRHVVCEADCPENEEKLKRTYFTLHGDERVYWLRPHQSCHNSLDYEYDPDFDYWDHETIPLRILRSCRQMYNEANNILWSTNTFSFTDGIAFKRFLGTRSLVQKRTLKKVRFQMDWTMGEHRDWNSALNIAVIRSLQGLRQLRLHIHYNLTSKDYDYLKNHVTAPYSSIYVEGLEKISILPLTSVEIVVKNPAYVENQDGYEHLWSTAERTEYAEGLRNFLLDPKGAEVYAQKQIEAKEMHRKQREFEANIKASMAPKHSIPNPPVAGASDEVIELDNHHELV